MENNDVTLILSKIQSLEDMLMDTIYRHEEAIFGNGSPGLKTDVATLSAAVDTLVESDLARGKDIRAIGGFVLVSLLGCVGFLLKAIFFGGI